MKHCIFLVAFLITLSCQKPDKPVKARTTGASRARFATGAIVKLSPDSPMLGQIRTEATVVKQFPVDEIITPGKLELNPNRVSRVLSPVAGRVQQVLVRLGDAVRENQPLAIIESAEIGQAMANYSQAQAQLRQARSLLAKAEKDLARIQDLYNHLAIPLKDLLAAENDMVQAREGVEQQEITVRETRHRLELLGLDADHHTHDLTVRSPIAGKVLEIMVAPGEYRNDTNAPLMTIADLCTIWATSQVPESLIRLITPGERVEIELAAFPGEIFYGPVIRIADTVDPATRTVKVQAELDNHAGRLRPEMFGTMLHTHGYKLLPAVPAVAVVRSDSETWVYRETSPGSFERVRVQCEDSRNGWVAVTAGLKAGDRVVVQGAVMLAGF